MARSSLLSTVASESAAKLRMTSPVVGFTECNSPAAEGTTLRSAIGRPHHFSMPFPPPAVRVRAVGHDPQAAQTGAGESYCDMRVLIVGDVMLGRLVNQA